MKTAFIFAPNEGGGPVFGDEVGSQQSIAGLSFLMVVLFASKVFFCLISCDLDEKICHLASILSAIGPKQKNSSRNKSEISESTSLLLK
jgi:hypothetical protein